MVTLTASFLLALVRSAAGAGVIVNEHTLSSSQVRNHVEVLGRWFQFISLEDLPRALFRQARRPFCLLTFDDGKRSNYTEVAPELERLGVPAVFYISTEPVTTGSAFWFDRQQQFVRTLGHCPPELSLAKLKQLPFSVLMERLERAGAGFCGQDGVSDHSRPMSWDEVRVLHRRGFAIGAHGHTHAILTSETRERAFVEIEKSIELITREIGAACTSFAFPNGSYNAELVQHVLRCGVSKIMTTDPTWVDRESVLYQLPRIQLFSEFSKAQIETKIALAAIKGILPNPNGSGRYYRLARRRWRTLLPRASLRLV